MEILDFHGDFQSLRPLGDLDDRRAVASRGDCSRSIDGGDIGVRAFEGCAGRERSSSAGSIESFGDQLLNRVVTAKRDAIGGHDQFGRCARLGDGQGYHYQGAPKRDSVGERVSIRIGPRCRWSRH